MSWPCYAPTPLHDFPDIAAACRVGRLLMKDEATRFGLGGPALGAAYAVSELLASELARTGTSPNATATDLQSGRFAAATAAITLACTRRFGRAVAWGCRALRLPLRGARR